MDLKTTNHNISFIRGDLLEAAQFGILDAIVHGCNCFCTMGSGIARQVRQKFPRAYEADLETISGDKNKLGTYSSAEYVLSTGSIRGRHLNVINAYTQYDFGGENAVRGYMDLNSFGNISLNGNSFETKNKKVYFDYDAFEKIFTDFNTDPKTQGKLVGIPWIGCGLAGGDIIKVLNILERVVKRYKVWIYTLDNASL